MLALLATGALSCGSPEQASRTPPIHIAPAASQVVAGSERDTPKAKPYNVCAAEVCATVTLPPADAPLDPRPRMGRPKVTKLLLVEQSNIERLLAATPRDDADRPRLIIRLADGYAELGMSLERENSAGAEKARLKAIEHYTTLLTEYADWCQFPKNRQGNRRCADEVQLHLGLEHERLGRRAAACESFQKVLDSTREAQLRGHACRGLERAR